MSYANAVIISDLVPDVSFEALAVSDGEYVNLIFMDKGKPIEAGLITSINLHRDDVERLVELINDPS